MTSGGATPGPPWGIVYISPPHSCPTLSQKTHLSLVQLHPPGAGLAKLPSPLSQQRLPGTTHGNAFPRLNGRKRWCVGNTQCCWSRGWGSVYTLSQAAWPSEAALRNSHWSQSAALASAAALCVQGLWCWMNPSSGAGIYMLCGLWGLTCCVPDLSFSGCAPVIFQSAFPQAAVQNKIIYP